MGRLINADELLYVITREPHWFVRCGDKDFPGLTLKQVFSAINDAPTVETIPIEWIKKFAEDDEDLAGSIYRMIEEWRNCDEIN